MPFGAVRIPWDSILISELQLPICIGKISAPMYNIDPAGVSQGEIESRMSQPMRPDESKHIHLH